MWLENWLIADECLHPDHATESMLVLINSQTKIQEADGKQWISRVPAVSFFIPGEWFNIVALMEEHGVRYYCNLASPPYKNNNIITYIDYDLDVIRLPSGEINVVDQDEYDAHKLKFHYSETVELKVKEGLDRLLERIQKQQPPFQDHIVQSYYEQWIKCKGDDEV
jgi:protein associated with RNAse G/E